MLKLTKKMVDSFSATDGKEVFFWDSDPVGFGVKVYPSGKKSFILQYRNALQQSKRLTLGYHGRLTVEQAKELARITLANVLMGKDPQREKREATLNLRKEAYTVKQLTEDYLSIYGSSQLSPYARQKICYALNRHIYPEWGDKKAFSISKTDIEELRAKLKHIPYAFNQLIAMMSSMYNRAIEWGKTDVNPFSKIKKFKEHKRLRWVDGQEFSRLLDTLLQYRGYASADALILILLTGSRKSEVLQSTWDQFNLERGVWIKPYSATKQKRDEHVPLSDQTIAFLLTMKESSNSKFLFPSRFKSHLPDTYIKDVKTFWTKVLKEAQIENLRIHDLRHTFASHLVSSGLSLSIVGKLLGHTQASTTQRYAHLADQSLRDATNLFSAKVKSLTQNKTSS